MEILGKVLHKAVNFIDKRGKEITAAATTAVFYLWHIEENEIHILLPPSFYTK
jgi:hypothetical protein